MVGSAPSAAGERDPLQAWQIEHFYECPPGFQISTRVMGVYVSHVPTGFIFLAGISARSFLAGHRGVL